MNNWLNTIHISITNRCPNACKICAKKSTNKTSEPKMSLNDFQSFAKQARELGASRIELTGGEPLTHPQIYEMCCAAAEIGFSSLGLLSGGWSPRFAPERVEKLRQILDNLTGKIIVNPFITFSAFAHQSREEAVLKNWQASLQGILELAPNIEAHISSFPLLTARCISDGFGTDLRLVELIERLGGEQHFAEFGGGHFYYTLPETKVALAFDDRTYRRVGFAEDLERIIPYNNDACYYRGFRIDNWFITPMISETGWLSPCSSLSNATAPSQAMIKLDPAQKNSLQQAILVLRELKDELVDSRTNLYEKMTADDLLCRACIQARVKLLARTSA